MARKIETAETEPTEAQANGKDTGSKRQAKAKIRYAAADGSEVKLTEGCDVIQFVFADGAQHDLDVSTVPEDIQRVAMVRGLAEKVRDTYAGAKTVEEAREAAGVMIERLLSGEWQSEGDGGGSPSVFLEAVKRVKEAAGLVYDDAASREKYVGKDKADTRKAALAGNKQLAAMFATIQAERAAERAQAAEKAAGGGTEQDAASL